MAQSWGMAAEGISDWVVRLARADDMPALRELAALTGGGFTNLPDDAGALRERLDWSLASCAASVSEPDNELYIFLLEHRETGRVAGTAAIFSRIGVRWPFYSYHIDTLSMRSEQLDRSFSTQVLHLSNAYNGYSEVGGLFLHPDFRSGGLGHLLARSRYLFIGRHQARFTANLLAELRGQMRGDGSSPFWNGLAGRFFEMEFMEADRFNSLHGNQFIADLMPKYPVYVALLTDEARAAIGRPHDDGRAAVRMLEREGFSYHGYVDIFDGGPTMDCPIAQLRAVREMRAATILHGHGRDLHLVARGQVAEFHCFALPATVGDGTLTVDAAHGVDGEVVHAPW